MKIKDLIEKLQEFDQEFEIIGRYESYATRSIEVVEFNDKTKSIEIVLENN